MDSHFVVPGSGNSASASDTPPNDSNKLFNQALRKREFRSLSAYHRHRSMIANYQKFHTDTTDPTTTNIPILQKHSKFVRTDEDEDSLANISDPMDRFVAEMAKSYYLRLYKEYALVMFGEGKKIALRWRTEKEVIDGRGQFSCAALNCSVKPSSESSPSQPLPLPSNSNSNRTSSSHHTSSHHQGTKKDAQESAKINLTTWELPFSYKEHGEKREALVKVRVCAQCSARLQHARALNTKKRRELEEDDLEVKKQRKHTDDSSLPPSNASQDIWKQGVKEEKSREEEFDEYFAGLFE